MPRVVQGWIIDHDGDGISGIDVDVVNENNDLKQTTETNKDGYFEIVGQGDFPIHEGDRITVTFTYDDEEYIDQQNAGAGVTTFEFEIEREESSNFWLWVGVFSLLLITGISVYLWKYEVMKPPTA